MEIKGWKYYNHAAIPACAPHEMPDLTPIKDGTIWKIGGQHGRALLARWTEDWDCGYDTGWYYTIMDTPFDINALKAKRRYVINQGIRHFDIRTINPRQYAEELFNITRSDIEMWPEKYRPCVFLETFCKDTLSGWQNRINSGEAVLYGAFNKETSALCGYVLVGIDNCCKEMLMVMANPKYEKLQIKAAMLNQFVQDNVSYVSNNGYISNGSKAVNHETAFNEYLEKYFGFRKAFCKLKIKYRPIVFLMVNILYPLKGMLERIDGIGIIHSVNVVLKLEEVVRTQKNYDVDKNSDEYDE